MKNYDLRNAKTLCFFGANAMKTVVGLFIILFLLPLITRADFAPYLTEKETVFPGIRHLRYRNEDPLMEIYVVEIAEDAPEISFKVQSAHNELRGRETVPDMVDNFEEDNPDCVVLSAINADFFANHGIPVNVVISDNFFMHSSIHRGSALFDGLTPFFEVVQTHISLEVGNEDLIFSHVNTLLPAQHPVLLTSHYYQFPIDAEAGIFAVYNLEKPELLPYRDYSLEFVETTSSLDSLEREEIAIYFPNPDKEGLLQDNPEAEIEITFLGELYEQLQEGVGGGPLMVKEGKNIVDRQLDIERMSTSFAETRHPRTAIGYNSQQKSTYFVAVDGRQSGYSMGINLYDLADFFIEYLHCDEAMNLDGGGSTTLMVRDQIRNKPSDNAPRTVANAILVCSTASSDEPARLSFPSDELRIFPGSRHPLEVRVKDEYFNQLEVDCSNIEWKLEPSELGEIKEEKIVFSEEEKEGYVTAKYEDLEASLPVYLTSEGSFLISRSSVEGYAGQKYPLEFSFKDVHNNPVTFSYENISVSEPDVLEVVDKENIKLLNRGKGELSFQLGNHKQQLDYSIGELKKEVLDDFSDTEAPLPEINGQNYNADNSKVSFLSSDTEPQYGLRIDYEFEGTGTSALYLDVDYPLPEEELQYVGLKLKGDGNKAWLRGVLEDADGEKFLIDFTSNGEQTGINWTGWKEVMVAYDDVSPYWTNPEADEMTLPLSLDTLYLVQPNPEYNVQGSIIIEEIFVETILSPETGGR